MVSSSRFISLDFAACITISHSFLVSEHVTDISVDVDLGVCSMLDTLYISLRPKFATGTESFDLLKATIDSWRARVPLQKLHIRAYPEASFSRQGFASLLNSIGTTVEEWAHNSAVPSSVYAESTERHAEREVCLDLYDWEVWKDWWWTNIKEFFPTLPMSAGLSITYEPRKYLSNTLLQRAVQCLRSFLQSNSIQSLEQMGRQ